ncbi:MAG: ABC transporter substrate-binding protein [Alphaproteobacteria bacterium]|nr:ABC transporter substrate-binding protein [Alphaproteobacteria bacterium]
MFKLFKFVFLALFLVIRPILAQPVAVVSTEARQWANFKGHELIEALGESDLVSKYAKLDKMMLEDINLDYVAKFVIGKYARLMNDEQKQRYHDLFQRYVLSLYKQASFSFDASRLGFSIESVTEYPKFTNVVCAVNPGQLNKDIKLEKIPVKFKLIRGLNNRIQAVDLEISSVSMVIEYRKRFYQMIQAENENMDWFLDKLNDKVIANEENILPRKVL